MRFNQDSSCFACGTVDGFAVYNIQPFRETFRRIFVSGGIGLIEMLYRCNLLAIVGGGKTPRYPPNKVMIWDDRQNRCVGELLFKTNVLNIKLRRDRIIVVLQNKVHVHRFKDLKLLHQINTYNNPKGLIAQSYDKDIHVIAVPGSTIIGSVYIELYTLGKFTTIQAHTSEISALALSHNGMQLATSSDKGTIIRTWDTSTGLLLRELRRGSDRAEIYSLCFNYQTTYLSCSSDKGTVHIFSLTENSTSISTNANTNAGAGAGYSHTPDNGTPTPANGNQTMTQLPGPLGLIQSMIPTSLVPQYFNSEWSFAQIRGIEGKNICTFEGKSNHIIVLSDLGIYTKCQLPVEPGDCPKLCVNSFLRGFHTDITSASNSNSSNSNNSNNNSNSDFVNDRNSSISTISISNKDKDKDEPIAKTSTSTAI